MNEIYKNFFKVDNLVLYGYYDAPIKYKYNNIKREIKYGSPDSIYEGLFSLEEFVDLIPILEDKIIDRSIDTEPITFTIPKTDFARRVYKFPNLYSYLDVCKYIVQHKDVFINSFQRDINSTSRYFNIEGYEYEITKEIEKQLLLIGKMYYM